MAGQARRFSDRSTQRGARQSRAGARILRYLEDQNPPAYQEVPYLGWHEGVGFVTHEGVITASGLEPHRGLMPSPTLQNLAPFRYGMGDEEKAVQILREILTYQDRRVAAVFGAWWTATILKGQIVDKVGHFPYFAVEAASESGKTRGYFRMMLNLGGSTRFGEWTKAATRDAIGSHRNGIVHIDDSNRLRQHRRPVAAGDQRGQRGQESRRQHWNCGHSASCSRARDRREPRRVGRWREGTT